MTQRQTCLLKCAPQARGHEAAPAHRDESDAGRFQVVIALASGAFDIWPDSHKLSTKIHPCGGAGHYHVSQGFQKYLESQCEHVVFSCGPGDVRVFQGGHFAHGSPAIGGQHPSPRVMTYATFWPPSTPKGQTHLSGKCMKPYCGMKFQCDSRVSPGAAAN